MYLRNVDPEIRLWMKVQSNCDGCWEWRGARKGGRMRYGTIHVGDKSVQVHRLSWILHFGPIPDNLFVCHKCDNPICVRPDHLFLGTNLDNCIDRDQKGRNVNLLGEEHGRAVLTTNLVRTLRAEYDAIPPTPSGRKPKGTMQLLAQKHGASVAAIEHVVWRKCWTHVADKPSTHK